MLIKSNIEYGLCVNTIQELADGKLVLGVSELIQVWDVACLRLLKVVPQGDSVKTIMPLLSKTQSSQQMLIRSSLVSSQSKAFAATSIFVSANSLGKVCIWEINQSG